MIIGHNPGISELAQLLVPRGEEDGLSTAAVCSISFAAEEWTAIGAGVRARGAPRAAAARGLFGLFG